MCTSTFSDPINISVDILNISAYIQNISASRLAIMRVTYEYIYKGGSKGGHRGHVPPPLASLIIYSFLNNFVIYTTPVHLREALSFYVGLPSFRGLQVYTTVFYPVFSNANNHELFPCAPPPLPFSEILDPPVIYTSNIRVHTSSTRVTYMSNMQVHTV